MDLPVTQAQLDDWKSGIKIQVAMHGQFGTSEVWWVMEARKPKSFLTYDTVYFYGHSPIPECAKYGIVVKYEDFTYYVSVK